MTFAAALIAVRTIRLPFWHRERTVPIEREASSSRVVVRDPDPVDWQRDLLLQCLLRNLMR